MSSLTLHINAYTNIFRFCGTTEDFCGSGCQSGCDVISESTCSGTSSEAVYIGYYEGWNPDRACDVVLPENINVAPWTHLYYSFAGIHATDFTITTTNANDKNYWSKFTALKKKKATLKTYIAIGGWDVGGKVFSDMVRFPGTRSTFIDSAISFMEEYGFDGIDIDWQYPAAEDRGGASRDTANLVTFLKELKAAVGSKYGITCTLPSSYWYLKGFDLAGMQEYVDFFNFMSYDIHGAWDGNSEWTSSVINPHTNLTEISAGLDLLWRNGIEPSKVLLGLGFYGRSFTLADTSCSTPGCEFATDNDSSGGARPGECTRTGGILSDYEIARIIDDYSVDIQYDEAAGVNWMTWGGDQWVSFDDGRTLRQKAQFANSKCLGGLFSWALDMGGPGSLKNPNVLTADSGMGGANAEGGSDGTGLIYVGQEVLDESPTVTAVAPVSVILPKSVLETPTTISLGGYPTSLEVAWSTIKTVTSDGLTTVTSTITRHIMSTTIPLDPITTTVINYYNWNISDVVTSSAIPLIPSIEIQPVVLTNDPNPLNETGVTHPPVTRTVSIPPWPWTTDGTKYPSITFTQGSPPGPTCTANCGHKCYAFCDGPCLSDCGSDSSSSFVDPLDPDPPSFSKCTGPGCVNGKCSSGGLCIEKGCTGSDCKDQVCVGDDCTSTACTGSDCTQGHCIGDRCQDHGCIGEDCGDRDNQDHNDDDSDDDDDDDNNDDDNNDNDDNNNDDDHNDDDHNSNDDDDDDDDNSGGGVSGGIGLCIGAKCLSWGCFGRDCTRGSGGGGSTGTKSPYVCTGPKCRIVSCSGKGCDNGVCTSDDCTSEDSDCEAEEADSCTEYISSSLVTAPVSTYSTTTVTSKCKTITACSAQPTTTTSTLDEDGLNEGTIYFFETEADFSDPSLAASLDAAMSSYYDALATTTTTTTRTTTKTTKTTTAPMATETGSDMAKDFLTETTIYGTTDKDTNSGTCYTDGKNAGFGCGVFVEGDDCRLTGNEMAAAYDHLFQETGGECKICGHAKFANGCKLTVNYVSGCHSSNGPLQGFVGNVTYPSVTSSSSSSSFSSSSSSSFIAILATPL
ncbi:hypothetical protein BJY04DRAFT_230539 [Aspergillus karnatakaensis]|uniref:uncharacterized protein n=1 Tax=Aspergillus karnatakaensis TaxID=1810916 RepID=UPI003CCCC452